MNIKKLSCDVPWSITIPAAVIPKLLLIVLDKSENLLTVSNFILILIPVNVLFSARILF